jgi:hypothetical protein
MKIGRLRITLAKKNRPVRMVKIRDLWGKQTHYAYPGDTFTYTVDVAGTEVKVLEMEVK